MPVTYKKIASVTVGAGGAASIEFTNIPATYTDLLLKFSLRGDIDSGTILVYFNGSTSNLSSRQIYGTGSGAASNSSATDIRTWGGQNQSLYTSNTFANAEMYIPNYAGNTNKSVSIDGVNENNATEAYTSLAAGLWANTSAITSIKLDNNNFVQYSTAVLYGISKS